VALGGERRLSSLTNTINPPGLGYLVFALVVVNMVTISAVFVPTLRAFRINIATALRID